MKKINTLKIVKAVSITAISSALIFGLTSCEENLLTPKEISTYIKLWLKKDKKGIKKLLVELKEKYPKKYKKIKEWLEKQKYTEDADYNIKKEIKKLENEGSKNGFKKGSSEFLKQLKSFRDNENELIDEKTKKTGQETKKNQVTQSPESITYGNKEDININFLNRLKYQENDFQYNKNENSFKNKKYHNFDGLRYSFSTYPYLKKKNFIMIFLILRLYIICYITAIHQ